MKIDEKFARYILSLQSVVKLERGLDENYDIPFRNKLEDVFPNLKKERETDEYKKWILTDKVSNTPEIKTLFSKITTTKLLQTYKGTRTVEDKQKVLISQEKIIKELDDKKEKYYNLFLNDPEIKKEYKLLKTIKKLSG